MAGWLQPDRVCQQCLYHGAGIDSITVAGSSHWPIAIHLDRSDRCRPGGDNRWQLCRRNACRPFRSPQAVGGPVSPGSSDQRAGPVAGRLDGRGGSTCVVVLANLGAVYCLRDFSAAGHCPGHDFSCCRQPGTLAQPEHRIHCRKRLCLGGPGVNCWDISGRLLPDRPLRDPVDHRWHLAGLAGDGVGPGHGVGGWKTHEPSCRSLGRWVPSADFR